MKHLKTLFLIGLITTVTACSSTTEKIANEEKQTAEYNARFNQSENQINKLAARLKQAQQDRLSYFSPDQFKDAREHYADAKEEFDDILADRTEATKRKSDRITQYVFDANQDLDKAYQTKQNADTIMAETFDIQNQLNSLNADKLLPKTYKSLMGDVDDVVEEIADGDLEDARSENARLLPQLRAFEVRIVKIVELKAANGKLKQLEKARASRTIPVSNQKAISAIRNAESVIAINPRDKTSIGQAVKAAEFELNHAIKIYNAVKRLDAVKRSQQENYLLTIENQLLSISKALDDADFRDLALADQSAKITDLATSLKEALAQQQAKVESLQATVTAGNKEGAALVAAVNQEKLALEQLLAAEKQTLAAAQQTLATANSKVLELEKAAFEKDQQLLSLEREKLSLNSQVAKLTAKVAALQTPQQELKPRTPEVKPAPTVEAAAQSTTTTTETVE